jgi:oligopeptide transport system substrate-binding protein
MPRSVFDMKGIVRSAASVAALISLASCGGGGAPASAVKVGGESGKELADVQVLRLGNASETPTLDPQKNQTVEGANILRDLFEGLIGEKPNGDLEPTGAESWTMKPDGKTYTFKLRRDAQWSDGTPVTAQDYLYSFRRAADPATLTVYSFILSPIVNADDITAGRKPPSELGVRALDDYTFEIDLAHPTPYFLELLAHETLFPVQRANVEKFGDQFTRPGNLVSNGAFMLAEWVVQSHIKAVRNPHYWNNKNTKLDEVWYYPTEDTNAELQRYRAGELDYTYQVAATQLKWVKANLPNEYVVAPYLGSYYYGFNLIRPPFQDKPKLRRALALAVNREIITDQVLGAGQKPAFGWVPPVAHYEGQEMPEAKWTQAERETEAKKLYAEAGYSAANPLRTEILYNTLEDHKRVAVAIASMWKQVLGVEATIRNLEWKVYVDTRNEKKETQVYRHGWIGDYNDAFTFAELLRSTTASNDTSYDNPEYDRLVEASQSELDLDKRAQLLEQAERVLLADMPILPLYFYVTQHMKKPWVGGWEPNILDKHASKYLYILKH